MAYLVYQIERGSEAGTQHLQGYVRFHNRKRLSTVKNVLENQGAHLSRLVARRSRTRRTVRRRTRASRGLSSSESTTRMLVSRGNARIWTRLLRWLVVGLLCKEIADAHPGDYIRYHAGIQALHLLIAPPPPVGRDVTVTVLWGPTGTGKTHRVLARWPTCYMVDAGGTLGGTTTARLLSVSTNSTVRGGRSNR